MAERLLSAKEVAELTGMSIWWCYDHAAELGGVKMGRATRFSEREVLEYRARHAIAPAAPLPAPEGVGESSRRLRRRRRRHVPLDPSATRSRP